MLKKDSNITAIAVTDCYPEKERVNMFDAYYVMNKIHLDHDVKMQAKWSEGI